MHYANMSKLFIEPWLAMSLIVCAWLLPHIGVAADQADDQWQLVAAKSIENCFCDRPAACVFQLTGPARQAVRVQWQVIIERRIWQRGSVRATMAADDKPTDVSFEFRAPPVNAGVIAGGKLRIELSDDQQDTLLVKDFPLWIFHENPFDTEFAWLKQLPIELIDPDRQLAGRLQKFDVPGKFDSSQPKHKRVLIVGQMAAWNAAVTQQIDQTLRDGGRVLCLATSRGQLGLSQTIVAHPIADGKKATQTTVTGERLELPEVHLANLDFMRQLDPRLGNDQLAVTGRGRIEYGPDERISWVIKNSRTGWAFLEAGSESSPAWMPDQTSTFTAPKNVSRPRLVYCGVDLMSRWQESPTPRYVLAKILERMCFEPEVTAISKESP